MMEAASYSSYDNKCDNKMPSNTRNQPKPLVQYPVTKPSY